jgi:dihydroorotate dehydrogenase
LYSLLRRLLFALDAEKSHDLALGLLDRGAPLGAGRLLGARRVQAPVRCLGLTFPNAVGLAAGLDKNADHLSALGRLGFGFVEVGTVTPRPQSGNPRPRLFRLPEHHALINRMGFNNHGVEYLVERLKRARFKGIVGVNIGKNRDTPVERAVDDYLTCLQCVYDVADYVVVNVSSPNTPGLRDLQRGDNLEALLGGLKDEQQRLAAERGRIVPLVLKIAPDLDEEGVDTIVRAVTDHGVDAMAVSNTTLDRSAVDGHPLAGEAGGLSGAPLRDRSTELLRTLRERLGPCYPLIGVGGILNAADALEKQRAGANLVQLYTGLIYRGPALIAECAGALATAAADEPAGDAAHSA